MVREWCREKVNLGPLTESIQAPDFLRVTHEGCGDFVEGKLVLRTAMGRK